MQSHAQSATCLILGVVIRTMHGVLLPGQQLDQGPEGVLLVHVDEQQGGDLTHTLAVSDFLWGWE